MGRGDRRTRRGKIFAGSYGISRKREEGKTVIPATTASAKKAAPAAKKKVAK